MLLSNDEGRSDSVELVSQILRVTTSDLEDALCSRQLYVDDKIIVQVQTVEQVMGSPIASAIFADHANKNHLLSVRHVTSAMP